MRISFRQGLISFQKDGTGTPQFLLPSTTAGFVALNVAPTPFIATAAQGSADYLLTADVSVPAAWQLTSGVTTYLFIDVDMLTANVSYGTTVLEPVYSTIEPVSPSNDQHWFDLNVNKFKVWSAVSNRWQEKIRLFVGKALNGNSSQLVPAVEGSTAGLNVPGNPGNIIVDSQLRPLRTSAGEFLTSDTAVRIKTTIGSAGVLAVPPNAFIPVRAAENIPPMSLVYFSGPDTVSLATSNPALLGQRTPVGVIQQGLAVNDVGTITQSGDIVYDQWDWSASIGKAVYCDTAGQITTTRPAGLMVYRVGFIKNKNTIVFGIDAETEPQIYVTTPDQLLIVGQTPVAVEEETNNIGERTVTISMGAAAGDSDGYMTASQANELAQATADIDSVEAAVAELQTGKADVMHTHIIGAIDGLQEALDGKLDSTANFDDRYSMLGHNHDERYALIDHTHQIADVAGLAEALDSKADRLSALVAFDRIFQSVDQTGATDVGSGMTLNAVLAGKADASHSHNIDDINGLEPRLDALESAVPNTIYVAKNGNDATATGSLSAPFASIQAAHNFAQTLNPNAFINIRVAAGTYADNLLLTRPRTSIRGEGSTDSYLTILTGTIEFAPTALVGSLYTTLFELRDVNVQPAGNSSLVAITMAGTVPFALNMAGVKMFADGDTQRLFVVTNTAGSRSVLRLKDINAKNAALGMPAFAFSNAEVQVNHVFIETGNSPAVDLGSNATINGFNFNPTSNSASFPAAMFNGNASLSNSVFNNAGGTALSVAASSFTSLSDTVLLSPMGPNDALVGSGTVFYSHLTFGENSNMANTLTLLAAPTSDKLSALRDVDAQSPNFNDVLTYNGTHWVPQQGAGQSLAISSLIDVQLGEIGPKDLLMFSVNGNWTNGRVAMLDISDVYSEGEPANGATLVYNAGSQQWIATDSMQQQIDDLLARVAALENPA